MQLTGKTADHSLKIIRLILIVCEMGKIVNFMKMFLPLENEDLKLLSGRVHHLKSTITLPSCGRIFHCLISSVCCTNWGETTADL